MSNSIPCYFVPIQDTICILHQSLPKYQELLLSASGNVGPFAASAIILHFKLFAIFALIWFSSAAGTRISHFVVSNSSVEIFLLPGYPTTEPFFCLYSSRLLVLMPFGLIIEPFESLAAITFAPIFSRYSPVNVAAFPKPCRTTFAPFILSSTTFAASLTQYAAPSPVATFLASEPPTEIGRNVATGLGAAYC